MTGSILSAINRFLTPDMITRIASAAGFDSKLAQGAVSAAAPAILAGLAKVAGTTTGADRISDAAASISSGGMEAFTSRLSNPTQLMEQGGSLLSSLLGGNAMSALTSGIAKYVGSSEGSTRSLLGLLAPAVLGVLGREQQASGGNGTGLARALRSQAGEFTAALPPGLANMLNAGGFQNISSVSDTTTGSATSGRERPMNTPPPHVTQPRATTTTTTSRGSDYSWAYWAIPLVALAALGAYLLGGDRTGREVATAPTTETARPAPTTGTAPSTTNQSATLSPGQVQTAMTLSSLLRQPLNSSTGEQLGSIQDVLITSDGRVAAVVVGTERALGIGEKRVILPFTVIDVVRRNGAPHALVFSGTKEQLSSAPSFEPADGAARPAAPAEPAPPKQ